MTGNAAKGAWVELGMQVPEPLTDQAIVVSIEDRTARVHLAWSGYRRLVFPLRAFSPSQAETVPAGTLRLYFAGETPEELEIRLGEARALADVSGRWMSKRELLDRFNLEFPELSGVREALADGGEDAACRALAAYFRAKLARRQPEPAAPASRLVEEARRTAAGTFERVGLTYTFPEGDVDWTFNPTQGEPNQTNEWVWGMSRHDPWPALAAVYRAQGDEDLARAWARQFRGWVAQMPSPAIADERPGSGWRGLEAGLRMCGSWPEVWYRMAASPSVTDEDILLALQSFWDHGTFLANHPYGPGNHYFMAVTGLLAVGAIFPEFREADTWRRCALTMLEYSMRRNVLPEGAWYEMSPAYHQWVVSRGATAVRIARENAVEVPPDLLHWLQRLAEWNVRLTAPDRSMPRNNDGNPVQLHWIAADRTVMDAFPGSPLLRWAAADAAGAADHAPPGWTSELLPDSGLAVMRTGWEREASFLVLDAGPLGGWHGHQDALNLVAWFHGRLFLLDNGGYKYDRSPWRQYGPSTAAHNTVLVDGFGQVRGYNPARDPIGLNPPDTPSPVFDTSPRLDYASAWYTAGYGPRPGDVRTRASHRREVCFLKQHAAGGPLAVVLDTLTPGDENRHTYELRWHIQTTRWQTGRDGAWTWTADPGKPNLALLSLAGAEEFHADSAVTEPEILGWDFPSQNAKPVPALTLRQRRHATGTVRLLTVLLPLDGDSAGAVPEVTRPADTRWLLHLSGGAKVLVDLSPMPASGRGIRIGDPGGTRE